MAQQSRPLVSVVVPIYNVEPYLAECIDSVLGQTYDNLEIILVDDGSTDGSPAICDEYADRDSRITVLHKSNGGLSDARNQGLAQAHGEWVTFIDSDDYVSPVFVEALLKAALVTGCSIVSNAYSKAFKDGDPCPLAESMRDVAAPRTVSETEMQRLMLYSRLDLGVQGRLYRRSILGAAPFPKGLYYEDMASVYKIMHGAGRVAILDCRELYAYRLRQTGIIRQSYSHLKGGSTFIIVSQLQKDITAWYPQLSQAVASRCFGHCRMVYAQAIAVTQPDSQTTQDRRRLWALIRQYRRTVLLDSHARKRERLAALIACTGEKPFATFCALARKMGRMQ